MRLLRIAEPFDDEDFVFEWKIDGLRSLALSAQGDYRLVSRNGHTFSRWETLPDRLPFHLNRRELLISSGPYSKKTA